MNNASSTKEKWNLVFIEGKAPLYRKESRFHALLIKSSFRSVLAKRLGFQCKGAETQRRQLINRSKRRVQVQSPMSRVCVFCGQSLCSAVAFVLLVVFCSNPDF